MHQSGLTHFKEDSGPAAAQFVLWAVPTYQDHLLSVVIHRASPVSYLLLSASLCGATPTYQMYKF